jgi:hypothetical protein
MHFVNILRIITFSCLEGHSNFNNSDLNSFRVFWDTLYRYIISIGNYTVREVLMKNRTRVWRNIYNTTPVRLMFNRHGF